MKLSYEILMRSMTDRAIADKSHEELVIWVGQLAKQVELLLRIVDNLNEGIFYNKFESPESQDEPYEGPLHQDGSLPDGCSGQDIDDAYNAES